MTLYPRFAAHIDAALDALPAADPDRSRHVADFIAGMTDRYAIGEYRRCVGEIALPEGF